MIPVFIISRNRPTYVRWILEQLRRFPEAIPIVVDNASDYQPMKDLLDEINKPDGIRIVSLNKNFGCYCMWQKGFSFTYDSLFGPKGKTFFTTSGLDYSRATKTLAEGLIEKLSSEKGGMEGRLLENYIVTDCDIDLSSVPGDAFRYMRAALALNPDRIKCGLALKINDIPPEYPLRNTVVQDQSKYWHKVVDIFRSPMSPSPLSGDIRVYDADVDTTFAMYRTRDLTKMNPRGSGKGLRIGDNYSCRHLDWYKSPESWSEEDWNYFKTAETYTYYTDLMNKYIAARGIIPPNSEEKTWEHP